MPLEKLNKSPRTSVQDSASLDSRQRARSKSSTSEPAPTLDSPAQFARPTERHGSDEYTRRRLEQQHSAAWSPKKGRNGVTSCSKVGEHGAAAALRTRDIENGKTAPSDDSEHDRPATLLGKRPSEEEARELRPSNSPSKKARLVPPGRLSLASLVPARTPNDFAAGRDLTSPLFFSSSPKPRIAHAVRFMDSDGIASMMTGFQESVEGVTTLRLPKGQVSSSSPTGSSSTSVSYSMDGVATARDSALVLQQLQNVTALELLEQDARPTFMIDLSNPGSPGPGALHIVFVNAALRASPQVRELLRVDTMDIRKTPEFFRFRAWAVGSAGDGESSDVRLPSLSYGGITWTYSTLRRRFRFVSASTSAASITSTEPSDMAQPVPVLAQSAKEPPLPNPEADLPRERVISDDDYFGDLDGAVAPDSVSQPTSRPASRSASRPASRPASIYDRASRLSEDLPMEMVGVGDDMQTTFDWTRIPLDTPNLTDHIRFVRSIDWASTPLGPIEDWSSDLRAMSNMVMGSPYPAAMYWGSEWIAIYNEAYIDLAGKRHPDLMGISYKEGWSEIWDEIASVFDKAWNCGQATMKHDDRLFLTRNKFVEETFFNWSIVPLVGSDGSVVALYNPAFENTRRKVNERRMLTLREIGEQTSQARDVKAFWRQVQKGLEYNRFDVPMALIYSVSDDSDTDSSSMHSGSFLNPPHIMLEGSVGVPPDHPAAIRNIDLRTSEAGFAPFMRDSMADSTNPVVLDREDGSLPLHLAEGFAWRGFGDPCRTIVVFPVHPTTAGDSVVGFIVLGVNPRRPYDDDYRLFVNLLSRQLATSLASVVLFEDEIKRGQRAAQLAALDRQELSLQLRLRTQEAVESEYRFSRMAALGPVGMFIADGSGRVTWCNDMWWEISGHERHTGNTDSWMQSIRDEDREGVDAAWRRLVDDKAAVTHEFRFKVGHRVIDGHSVDTWVLLSAYPEKNKDGNVASIFGCLTDISQQKWAEHIQAQRREEAVELKRQQENFIDITSHEMRNPLSAMLQCADEIVSLIKRYRSGEDPSLDSMLAGSVAAADTISLCANHQKRIVDDVLTLSKLDSQLLLVTPVEEQPVEVIHKVVRMFGSELNTNSIKSEFVIEDSYKQLGVDWVKMDPSRLRQVLINLMTNAIKFTQGREKRSIVVSLGASRVGQDEENLTDKPEWGTGEKVNIHIAVSDTGPGLDEDEKQRLFQRFSQASPRTHVQYGGSGLGLFICRVLTELQGGEINVESRKGEGSTFSFYIRARKCANPFEPEVSRTNPATAPSLASQDARPGSPSSTSQVGYQRGQQAREDSRFAVPSSPPPRAVQKMLLDVLIVEDNLVNQQVLERQLSRITSSTLVANHGLEALEMIRRSRFWRISDVDPSVIGRLDLPTLFNSPVPPPVDPAQTLNISVILMDLEMPVMDGMTCARKIRELEANGVISRHIPIIAVTAYARPEQIEDAKALGIDDVISKPFRIPQLMPKIEELVAKFNTRGDDPLPDSVDAKDST